MRFNLKYISFIVISIDMNHWEYLARKGIPEDVIRYCIQPMNMSSKFHYRNQYDKVIHHLRCSNQFGEVIHKLVNHVYRNELKNDFLIATVSPLPNNLFNSYSLFPSFSVLLSLLSPPYPFSSPLSSFSLYFILSCFSLMIFLSSNLS